MSNMGKYIAPVHINYVFKLVQVKKTLKVQGKQTF